MGRYELATGTYTGTGADARDIPVGFQPDMVWVVASGAGGEVWSRTDQFTGDSSQYLGTGNAPIANYIQGFGATTFQVGTSLNSNTVVYYWIAWKKGDDTLKYFQTGQYTGTGIAHDITGSGFQPTFASTVSQNGGAGYEHVWKNSSMGTPSAFYKGRALDSTTITGFVSDGFTVGTSSRSNEDTTIYKWFTTRSFAGKIQTGSYLGNGSSQAINVGFEPHFVMLVNSAGDETAFRDQDLSTTYLFDGAGTSAISITALTSTGFTVGAGKFANKNGNTIYYIAMSRLREYSPTINSNAMIKQTYTVTTNSNSFIKKIDNTVTINSDSFIKQTYSGTLDSDAMIKQTYPKTINTNSFILKPGTEASLIQDDYIKATYSSTIDSNSFIKKLDNTETIDSDSYIKQTYSSTINSNAMLKQTYSSTINSNLFITTRKRLPRGFQRSQGYDGTRFWRGSYDYANSRIMFEYSEDQGATWIENTNARISSIAYSGDPSFADFSVVQGASNIYLVYKSGSNIYAVKSTSFPSQSFSWSGASLVFDGAVFGGGWLYANVAAMKDERLVVSATLRVTSTADYRVYFRKSTVDGSITNWASAEQVSSLTNKERFTYSALRPSTLAVQDRFYIVYNEGVNLYGKYYNGSLQGADSIGTLTSEITANGYRQWFSLEHDLVTAEEMHVTYVDSSGDLVYQFNPNVSTSDNWNSSVVVSTGELYAYPNIALSGLGGTTVNMYIGVVEDIEFPRKVEAYTAASPFTSWSIAVEYTGTDAQSLMPFEHNIRAVGLSWDINADALETEFFTWATSLTSDAYIKQTYSSTITSDAWILKITDATIDSNSEIKAVVTKMITSDAKVKTTYSATIDSGARIKKEGEEGSINSNYYIKKTYSATISSDAYIKQVGSDTISSDAKIKATNSGTITSDAEIKKAAIGTITEDAYIKATYSSTITQDDMIKRTYSATITQDAYIGLRISETIDSDAKIKTTYTVTLNSKARIAKAQNPTIDQDAKIKATSTKTITSDYYIEEAGQTYTINEDAWILKIGEETLDSDAYITKTYSSTITQDDYIKKLATAETLDSNANITKAGTETITQDDFIKQTYSASLNSNANISKDGTEGSINQNDYIKQTYSGTITSDAQITKEATNTITSDYYIKTTYTNTLTSDAYVKKDSFTETITSDSYILRTFGGKPLELATPDLVSLWRFDELSWAGIANEIIDAKYTNDGRALGASTTTSEALFGRAALLSGSGTGANFGTDDSLYPDHISVSIWVYPTAFTNLFNDVINENRIRLTIRDSGYVEFYVNVLGSGTVNANSDGPLSLNKWQYLTGTYDGSTVKLYVDSVEQAATASATGVINWGINILYLGQTGANSSEFTGRTDDFGFFEEALPQQTITEIWKENTFLFSNSYILKSASPTIDSNAWIKQSYTGTITSDAEIKATSSPTINSNAKIKTTYSATLDSNAYIEVAGEITSITSDSKIRKVLSVTITSDAEIKGTTVGAITSDAKIKVFGTTKTIDSNAYILDTYLSTITSDAWINAPAIGALTSDYKIKRLGYTTTIGVDAKIKQTYQDTITQDAYLAGAPTHSIISDYKIKATSAGTISGFAVILELFSGTLTSDYYINKPATGTIDSNYMIKRTHEKSFLSSSYVISTHTITGMNMDYMVKQSYTGTITSDAKVFVPGSVTSITSDAWVLYGYDDGPWSSECSVFIILPGEETITSDYWILATPAATITSDYHIKKKDIPGSIVSDYWIIYTYSQELTSDYEIRRTDSTKPYVYGLSDIDKPSISAAYNENVVILNANSLSYTEVKAPQNKYIRWQTIYSNYQLAIKYTRDDTIYSGLTIQNIIAKYITSNYRIS